MRTCENPGCTKGPHCGPASIDHRAPQARTCDAECRKAKMQYEKRSRLGQRTVSLADGDQFFDALDAIRGYLDDWTPTKKIQIMLGRAQNILDEYADQLPLTCRQIYYRMIAEFSYPKGKEFEGSLYRALKLARRAEMIPFDSIRDDGILHRGWSAPENLVKYSWVEGAECFNRDKQAGQPYRIEVWCEAAGMLPQIGRVCAPYSMMCYSNGGFNSLTAVRQIVDYAAGTPIARRYCCTSATGIRRATRSFIQAIVEDAAAFLERDREHDTQELHWERMALTRELVTEFKLPADEIKTNDSRSRIYRERNNTTKVELEALAPDQIARLLREAIEKRLDHEVFEQVKTEQVEQRRLLQRAAQAAQAALYPEARMLALMTELLANRSEPKSLEALAWSLLIEADIAEPPPTAEEIAEAALEEALDEIDEAH